MVVRPNEIVDWGLERKRIEGEIDAKLKADWKGAGQVRYELPVKFPERLAQRLIQTYKDAGWSVEHRFGSCQKDGDWNYLDFSVEHP